MATDGFMNSPDALAETEIIRCFFAIPIQPALIQTFTTIIHQLKKNCPNQPLRWLEPENLHITLRFIGPTNPSQIKALITAAHLASQVSSVFTIDFTAPTFFPSLKKPRVVVLNTAPALALNHLADSYEQIARNHGFPAETRPFRAHLTLARIKSTLNKIPRLPALPTLLPLSMTVDKIILFQSVLSPSEATYRIIETFSLNPSILPS